MGNRRKSTWVGVRTEGVGAFFGVPITKLCSSV